MSDPNVELRAAARLVVLDAARRVLLFRYADGHGQEFWATPGGGVEPGETAEQAARRETAEELGAEAVEVLFLWTGHTRFVFAGRNVSQDETFFLLKRHSDLFGDGVDRAHRAEGILETRWWSLDEIERTEVPVFPADLAWRMKNCCDGQLLMGGGAQDPV